MKRRLTRIAVSLVFLVGGAVIFALVDSERRLHKHYDAKVPQLAYADTTALRERGQHLTQIFGCTHCHGEDLGGAVIDDNAVLRLAGPNLTPGGALRGYGDDDWSRAILHGLDRSGRPLLVMPSHHYRAVADDDVVALVAYLRHAPPIAREVPPAEVRLVGKVLMTYLAGDLLAAEEIDHAAVREARSLPALTEGVEHGRYLTALCRGCHGSDLRGGPHLGPPETPNPPSLAPEAMASWSKSDFERALREGLHRDGTPISEVMPWRATRHLSPLEFDAMWAALRAPAESSAQR